MWFDDRETLLAFVRALIAGGWFSDLSDGPSDLLYVFEKPWKWEPEYQWWLAKGKPAAIPSDYDERTAVAS